MLLLCCISAHGRLSMVRSGSGSGHSGQNLNLDPEVQFRYLANLDLDLRVQVQQVWSRFGPWFSCEKSNLCVEIHRT